MSVPFFSIRHVLMKVCYLNIYIYIYIYIYSMSHPIYVLINVAQHKCMKCNTLEIPGLSDCITVFILPMYFFT